jgi:hypothetical protein
LENKSRVLLIPNTTSWQSYISLANKFEKEGIIYKLLLINKSVKYLSKNIIGNKNIICVLEPNYKNIYKKNTILKIAILFFLNLYFFLFSLIILKKYKFKNIILPGDRDTTLTLSLIKNAKLFGIKILNMHSGIFAMPQMIKISRNNSNNYIINKESSTYILFKKYCLNLNNKNLILIYYDKIHIYLHKLFNILPQCPWYPGGGNSDEYLVEYESVKKLYKAWGCKKEVIFVGSPNFKNFLKVSNKLETKQIIGIILTQWFEHGLTTKQEHLRRNKLLCEYFFLVNKKYNFDVKLYLHPKQQVKDYMWVKNYNIKISKNKISEEIENIDMIIMGFSSSIIGLAIDNNIPTIVADLFNEKVKIFYKEKNLYYAKNLSQFLIKLNFALRKLRKNYKKKINPSKKKMNKFFLRVFERLI